MINAQVKNLERRLEDFTDQEYKKFTNIIHEDTGIYLDDNKKSLIFNRIQRRLKDLGLANFSEYLNIIETKEEPEYSIFVSSITTNYTFFFREQHHFDYLREQYIPDYLAHKKDKLLRVWSAASSSGQEVYSIAMTFADLVDIRHIKFLATDIDDQMLKATEKGIYAENQLQGLDDYHKAKWMTKREDGSMEVKEELRNMVITKKLNLCESWPIRPSVDLIFCRNVLIYFQNDLQNEIIRKFKDIQAPGSVLIMGHTESIRGVTDYYERIENTIYVRR